MTQNLIDPAPRLDRAAVAKRAARDLVDGWTVNLGIGIPALCADFLPAGVELRYHAENGVLGFEDLAAPGEGDPNLMDAGGKFPKHVPGMAFFDGGGVRLMFSEQPEGPLHASILYYRVDDLDAAHAMLKAKNVEFIRPPHFIAKMEDHDLWMAFLTDPDGHTLALMAEIRRGGNTLT